MREMIEHLEEYLVIKNLKGVKKDIISQRRNDIIKFIKWLKDRDLNLSTISNKEITEFLEDSNSSIFNRKLLYLRDFFEYLVQSEVLLLNPSMKIQRKKVNYNTREGYSKEEIKAILNAIGNEKIDKRDRAIIEIFYSSGIRLSELTGLDLTDMDLRNREFLIRNGKGLTERIVPVGHEAINALEEYLQVRPPADGALFISRKGRRLTPMGVIHMINRRLKAAGVRDHKGSAAHGFRHSCATHMLSGGAPVEAIQRILGHCELSATIQYLHLSAEGLFKAYSTAHPDAKEELYDKTYV